MTSSCLHNLLHKKNHQVQNQSESNQTNGYCSLEKKIDIITKSLSRAYYKNILIKLVKIIIQISY